MSGATRGPKPGSGSAQARIVAVLTAAGCDMSGLPKALRAAELAEKAKVNHHSLAKCTGALLAAGTIVRCLIQPAKGPKTFEYRIGPGRPPQDHKPLDTRKSGVARGPIGKPIPVTTPAPKVQRAPMVRPRGTYPATTTEPDAAMLARVQTMSEAEFGGYVAHLARVWAWGRNDKAQGEAQGSSRLSPGAVGDTSILALRRRRCALVNGGELCVTPERSREVTK